MAKVEVVEEEIVWKGRKRIWGMPISFTKYTLTESKLLTTKGFLSITEDELDLYKVADKSLSLPIGQRIFGCGSIIINVPDMDTPLKVMKSIKAPRDVLKLLDACINEQKDRYRTRGRDVIGTADEVL
jgi:hypothetical protein